MRNGEAGLYAVRIVIGAVLGGALLNAIWWISIVYVGWNLFPPGNSPLKSPPVLLGIAIAFYGIGPILAPLIGAVLGATWGWIAARRKVIRARAREDADYT